MRRQPSAVSCGGRCSTITATMYGGCHVSLEFQDRSPQRVLDARPARCTSQCLLYDRLDDDEVQFDHYLSQIMGSFRATFESASN